MIDYSRIPPRAIGALLRWRINGIPTGGALEALLDNDLPGWCNRADEEYFAATREIVSWVRFCLPSATASIDTSLFPINNARELAGLPALEWDGNEVQEVAHV